MVERPLLVYDVHYQQRKEEQCPIFSTGHGEGDHDEDHATNHHDAHQEDKHHPASLVPKDEIYKRQQLFPSERYHRTFFVWASEAASLSTIIDTFNSTALICPQKVDGGVFHMQSRY